MLQNDIVSQPFAFTASGFHWLFSNVAAFVERSNPQCSHELPPLGSEDLHFMLNCCLENVSGFINLACLRAHSNDSPNVGSFAPVLLLSNSAKKKTIGESIRLRECIKQFTESRLSSKYRQRQMLVMLSCFLFLALAWIRECAGGVDHILFALARDHDWAGQRSAGGLHTERREFSAALLS